MPAADPGTAAAFDHQLPRHEQLVLEGHVARLELAAEAPDGEVRLDAGEHLLALKRLRDEVDRADLEALPQEQIAALASLCGTQPSVDALIKAGVDPMQMKIATVASALIGSVTLFGSYVAFGKLAEFLAAAARRGLAGPSTRPAQKG